VAVAAPAQRRALGVLFLVLTLLFGLIAVAALGARQWVVAVAAAALGAWLASMAWRGLRSG
jgi:heme O synthase-like polyprenyltransferase